ncbi:MAG: sulfur carrier protein ThiS [Ethanoligenens sp.]|uniref:sulfur carrier protein ThiS n=1 Tax=Ethanoligenens sp. TaxID=2099655 RepID=UPI0039ED47B0
MKIQTNGQTVELEKELTVQELLQVQNVNMPEYVTVQINDNFIPRTDFETHVVKEGDAVEFLYFMGGGAQCQ